MKKCSRCRASKSESEFSPHKNSPGGLFSWCRSCNAKSMRDRYRSMNEEERREHNLSRRNEQNTKRCRARAMKRYREDPSYRESFRAKQNANRYKLSTDEYAERMSRTCEICGEHRPRVGHAGGMHIDHDHRTGKLRGTLCHNCNLALGRLRDDPEIVDSAAAYLRKYR